MPRWTRVLALRLRSLFRRTRVEDELHDELQFHLDQLTRQHIDRGMAADAAASAARLALGGVQQRKEECRDARRVRGLETAIADVRYALRRLRRNPGFTAASLLSLALGIGANGALFQLIDAITLRPLPVDRPYELAEVRIAGGNGGFGLTENANSQMTNPLWEQLREHQQAFAGLFAWGTSQILIGRGAEMRSVNLLWVSGELFDVLRVPPARGRLFAPSDDRRGCGAPSVVVSDDFWRSYYGAAPSAIGSRLTVMDQAPEVIGVTPPDFFGLDVGRRFDIALPLCTSALWGNSLDQRNRFWLTVMGRLKPGVTVASAAAHVSALSRDLFAATVPPGYDAAGTARYQSFQLTALPAARGASDWRTQYERALWWMLGMTGIVLLIGCVNISNLMLARANAHRREIAVRVALGASRTRIVLQTLVEGLVLAMAGGAIGVLVAGVMSRALVSMVASERNPLDIDLTVDWRLLAFIASVTLVTCLAFSVVPSLRAAHVEPLPAMQSGGRGSTTHRRVGAQRVMVVCQVSFSLALLVAALLFVRSFRNLTTVDTGLRQEGIAFVQLGTIETPRPSADQILLFDAALRQQVGSISGVESAATTSNFPLNGASWTLAVTVRGPTGDVRRGAKFTYVSPGYFSTFGIATLAGRDFADADTSHSRKVTIVNETFVRRYVSGSDPLGKMVRTVGEPGYPAALYEIVGVVSDTKYADIREERPPIAYVPLTQHPNLHPFPGLVLRSSLPASVLLPAIRQRVADLNPNVAIGFTMFDTQMRDRVVRERTLAWLASGFGLLAILMSAVGLYGVISYMTVSRRQEIAIRRALGAGRSAIVSLILSETVLTLAAGIPLGWAASAGAVHGASGLLFGLSPHDPRTFAASAAMLSAIALAASAIPAIRATHVSAIDALRND